MSFQIAPTERNAERHEPILTGKLQRIGTRSETRDSNRRMRFLKRADMILERIQHRIDAIDRPVLTFVFKRLRALPQFEDNIERFQGHFAVFTRRAINVK